MAEILIAVASRHGHTGKIATRIADVLGAAGHRVQLCTDIGATDPCPDDFDLVIAGASVHNGHHLAAFTDWARRHATVLSRRPSALFSVCLSIVEDTDQAHAKARSYLDACEDRTGWRPRLRTTFAGAAQYSQYDLPTRLFMRVMLQRLGRQTDIHHDHDFTDWNAVETFARNCAALPAPTTA